MKKIFIVYSIYSEPYEDPSVFFVPCKTEEKAKECFNQMVLNAKLEARDLLEDVEDFEELFSYNEGNQMFEMTQENYDKKWEVYYLEEDILE